MIDVKTKFIAVSIYTVTAKNFAALAEAAAKTMQHDVPTVQGFCEGVVMADETQTRVLIVTQWLSKQAWSQANWEPRIGEAVATLVQDARSYDVQTFEPLAIVRTSA